MPTLIRYDLTHTLLKKIQEEQTVKGESEIHQFAEDSVGEPISDLELVSHLDYLNQKGYIHAVFTGQPYDNVNPMPALSTFKKASLTERGSKLLEKMEAHCSQSDRENSRAPIDSKHLPFLEKVMVKANLQDIFEARDVTEIVFRIMRDLMTTEAADRVAAEFPEKRLSTPDKNLPENIVDLWQDTNPLVAFLSRIRPPLAIKPETFLFRVREEGGTESNQDPETVVKAVFSATRDELSAERIEEIASFLPGKIRQMWEQA